MKTTLILIILLAIAIVGTACKLATRPSSSSSNPGLAVSAGQILYYVCPMHPTIKYDKPGDCPICDMKLQPVYAAENQTNAPAATPAGCCSWAVNP